MLYLETRILSSMEKVFPMDAPSALTVPMTALQNEKISFQIALRPQIMPHHYGKVSLKVTASSDLPLTIYEVGSVPANLPYYNDEDGNYLSKGPGLYPDTLFKVKNDKVLIPAGRWSSLFIAADTTGVEAGTYPIKIELVPSPDWGEGYAPATVETSIKVVGAELPVQDLKYTCWFHADCLADYYHVPVFSEKHWEIIENHMRAATAFGQTMILTPLFTPPLDTAVGGERTTTQLVKVYADGENYSFNFDLVDRWIDLAKDCGFTYMEMSHLFTQWGGTSCPKIMATLPDGTEKKIFGWDNASTSDEYAVFLKAFIPALVEYLDQKGLCGHAYFHLTDEPHKEHMPQYLKLKNIIEPMLKGYPIMDALSDYDYFISGVSQIPVVGTSSLDPFLKGQRPEDFWVYYCCSQGNDNLSNRFLAMPGFRTRILGWQLYQENVKGFLQWGLNFYNSQYSYRHIDPYKVTDGGLAFPGGDPFMLYPGEDGEVVPCLRLFTFNEGLQDNRALKLLESLTSRQHVLDLIKSHAGDALTFTKYPQGEAFQLNLRKAVNEEIASQLRIIS